MRESTAESYSLGAKRDRPPVWCWFCLSLIAPLYFGLIALHYSFSQPYIVQDDARVHIIWLQSFVDSQLFPDDLIAKYYQTIQAIGFKVFYWIAAKIGIEPMVFAKVLPTALGLITTCHLFNLALEILPIPLCGFLTTLILNQNIWLKDDLISATPRAFVYPIFVAFLYYLVRRSLIPCLITVLLQGLFYPQLVLVEIALLTVRLFRWQGRSLQLSREQVDYVFWLCGLLVASIVLLPFSLTVAQEFGALLTVEQMKTMPEFRPNGRKAYFGVDWISFIFRGASGIRFPLFPPIIWAGVSLPFLLQSHFPLVKLIGTEVKILLQILVASLSVFGFAHLLFPKLYFPNRYTLYSSRVVMAIATGLVLTILLYSIKHWLHQKRQRNTKLNGQESLFLAGVGMLAIAVLTVPAIPAIFLSCQNWIIGETPETYRFLANQPKQTLIASLSQEADNLPAFSQRSVLVSQESAVPFHPIFYDQMKQRMIDLIHAQYSSDLLETQAIIQKYGIDFFVLERNAFNPDYLLQQNWLIHSSVAAVAIEAVAQLKQGVTPALASVMPQCSVLAEKELIIVEANCIQKVQSKPNPESDRIETRTLIEN